MIPAPLLLVWRYRKLAGYVLAAAAIAVMLWRVAAWREGYQARAEAVSKLEIERKGRAADRQAWEAQAKQSEADRERLQADFAAIRAKFSAMPVPAPKTLIRTIEVPRETPVTSCPEPRVSPEFVSLWNAAGTP